MHFDQRAGSDLGQSFAHFRDDGRHLLGGLQHRFGGFDRFGVFSGDAGECLFVAEDDLG